MCVQVLDLGHCMIGERGISELANSVVNTFSKTSESRLRWLLLSNNNAGSIGLLAWCLAVACACFSDSDAMLMLQAALLLPS